MTVPFACVGIAVLLIYFPRLFVWRAQSLAAGGYDNKHPRDQQAKLEGWGRRANAAHLNAFESFAPFAASVFVAHLGGGSPQMATMLAVSHVVCRVVYSILYIANLDKLRSTVWTLAFLATLGLFGLPLLK
jgi:uncharacterized MAPEG superfamily protein